MPFPNSAINRNASSQPCSISAAALASTQPPLPSGRHHGKTRGAGTEVYLLYVKDPSPQPWAFIEKSFASLVNFLRDAIHWLIDAKSDSDLAVRPCIQGEKMPAPACGIAIREPSEDHLAMAASTVQTVVDQKQSKNLPPAVTLCDRFNAYLTSIDARHHAIDMLEKLPESDGSDEKVRSFFPNSLLENISLGEARNYLRILKISLDALLCPQGDAHFDRAMNALVENFEALEELASDWSEYVESDDTPKALTASEMKLLHAFMLHARHLVVSEVSAQRKSESQQINRKMTDTGRWM